MGDDKLWKMIRNLSERFRFGKWAAPAAVFLLCGLLAASVLQSRKADCRAEEPGEKEIYKTEKEEGSGLRHAESYEALFQMLQNRKKTQNTNTDMIAEEPTVFENDMGSDLFSEDISYGLQENSMTAEQSTAYSSTNTQEAAIDEADIVKTDGTYLYLLDHKGTVRIIDPARKKITATIPFSGSEAPQNMDMYVDGDTLQLIWSDTEYVTTQGELSLEKDTGDTEKTRTFYSIPTQVTTVETYNLSDRSAPEKTGTYTQTGSYQTSRKSGDFLYVFTTFLPWEGAYEADRKEYYVPKAGGSLLPHSNIYYPEEDKEMECYGNTWLVGGSVDKNQPSDYQDRIAVLNGGENVYVSEKNIFMAYSRWSTEENSTELIRLGYEDGKFTAGSAGQIPGTLNNTFSMNEYRGYLRVVTTKTDFGSRSNNLYVLDDNLNITGRIENLAEGETIQSARFLGDTGYFVTYRNTDPLFSVDLSSPEKPEILGELKITGFSQYLHFYGKDRLLGIGWETDPETGERYGMKCSMFDLSDPASVREADKLVLGDVSYCEALTNYKGIMIDPDKNIFGLAYTIFEETTWKDSCYYAVFTYNEQEGFRPLTYIRVSEEMADGYDGYRYLRGVYIGDTFYLTGIHGLQSYDMNHDFEKTGEFFWE